MASVRRNTMAQKEGLEFNKMLSVMMQFHTDTFIVNLDAFGMRSLFSTKSASILFLRFSASSLELSLATFIETVTKLPFSNHFNNLADWTVKSFSVIRDLRSSSFSFSFPPSSSVMV